MLETIKSLPNRKQVFSCANYAIYKLDDNSVHISNEVRKAFLERGYILICIGGGVTGDIQINDTHYHHNLKKLYIEKKAKLMLTKLQDQPGKIPSPTHDEMMSMLHSS